MNFSLLYLLTISLVAFGSESSSPKIFGGNSLVDKTMNPAISLNGLLLGSYGPLAQAPGLQIQEVEAQFTAAVDPYFMGNFIIAAERGGTLSIEEAYFSTLSLPQVTLKGGKFLTHFGKNNLIHLHAQPLIDRPLVNRSLLGDDGYNSVGLEASLLVPTPWFFEFTAGALTASDRIGSTPFLSTSQEALAGAFRMVHLFDLSDVTTFELGSSYTIGDGQIQKKNVTVFGGDFTLKYLSGKGRGDFAISWSNEYLESMRADYSTINLWEKARGFYSTVLCRLGHVFWAGARLDYLKVMDTDVSTVGDSLIIAYVPSEFSSVRLQGGRFKSTGEDSKWQILLQYNMTIGSHPAHAY